MRAACCWLLPLRFRACCGRRRRIVPRVLIHSCLLVRAGKIEGPFKVDVPLLHLGYEKPDPKRESTV